MKRIVKISFLFLLLCLPFALVTKAQDRKEEKHVKVVITGKDGTRVIMDTTLAQGSGSSKIRMEGDMIIVTDESGVSKLVSRESKGNGTITVTMNSGSADGSDKEIREIYITKGDSSKLSLAGEDGKIFIIPDDKSVTEGKGSYSWSSVSSDKGRKVYYFDSSDSRLNDGEKRFDIEVLEDETGKQVEKSHYVLAKDGMVISIEGDDEAKIQDLARTIEEKLGVKKDGKTEIKEEVKKKEKKR
ncbi:MAG: hypothetical protein U0X39_11090 [Bacteroidales bacterium]